MPHLKIPLNDFQPSSRVVPTHQWNHAGPPVPVNEEAVERNKMALFEVSSWEGGTPALRREMKTAQERQVLKFPKSKERWVVSTYTTPARQTVAPQCLYRVVPAHQGWGPEGVSWTGQAPGDWTIVMTQGACPILPSNQRNNRNEASQSRVRAGPPGSLASPVSPPPRTLLEFC